ncbi:carbohydrate esterase family 4 protein [Pleurotus ostreatus PC15]|uniref:chitin deacetylase n=2 Tax=Pleurotus TaxID=5320 RepID=A0A067NTY7_PLEO1|nr:hypothetical protein CCMSSC00406_0000198 [Pleurotus cornucopiae]KDQ30470.1 carbohydrate esterase family 4 protein [Pleurotus ostreatus PC15]
MFYLVLALAYVNLLTVRAQSSPPSSAPSAQSSVGSAVGSAAPTSSGVVTSALPPPATTFSFSLQSTNPTAAPLSEIVSGAPLSATQPLASTASPGATPSSIPNAPPLPDPATLNPAAYPPLDRPPPVDSPEVQQWKQEVANSGITIPGFEPTVAGGCPANPGPVADASRCWWTCGGCTRESDVTNCPDQMTWGLTYDDGPANYTSNLLQYLDQANLKSTFFVVGSRVISFPRTLQLQYLTGHQIAVHTWSHPPLTTLSNDEIIAELGWSRKAIKDVLGVTPNMMRPPFGDIDDRVRAISVAMGLTPVLWTRISPLATFDTDDFNIAGGIASVQQVLHNWEDIVGNATTMNSGFIVLEHDLFQQSVEVATGYILPDALAHQPAFRIEPVISCLNKPLGDAYVETNDNATNPPIGGGAGHTTAVVTLASGAPGSASATGAASNTNSGVSFAPSPLAFVAAAGLLVVAFA